MEIDSSSESDETNRQRIRSRRRKRVLGGLNSGAAILLMFILVVMLNYISSRNYVRYDWSRSHFYKLSDKTQSLLKQLPGKVNVTVFIQPGHEIYQLMYDDVINLLREYEYASGNLVQTERVDPDRNLSRAEAIMHKYDLASQNVVIFEYGERKKVISADDLMDLDYGPTAQGGQPEKTSFRGEQAFSSALLSITQASHPKMYFMQGHGERNFDDRDEYSGLSAIGQQIRNDDIELAPFSFITQNNLPEDAAAVIIAGPTRLYAPGELERIAAFVNRTGRLILMLNAETDAGFGPLLKKWGVESVNNIVVDPAHTLSGFDLLISDYADHPVTARLKDITTVFYWPRALPLSVERPAQERAADEPKATALALSSANSWAELELEQKPSQFNADRDIKGPMPVAVAIERGTEASAEMDIRPARVVLFGDVDFISNSGLSGGNGDLFLNSVNWILDRNQLMAIAPRPVEQIKMMISQQQLAGLFWVVVAGVPMTVATLGIVVWWRRRN